MASTKSHMETAATLTQSGENEDSLGVTKHPRVLQRSRHDFSSFAMMYLHWQK